MQHRRKPLLVMAVIGVLLCSAAAVYRLSWSPGVVGNWVGAFGTLEGPPAASSKDYTMPIQLRADGSFADEASLTEGTWKLSSQGVKLLTARFGGRSRQEGEKRWTRHGRISRPSARLLAWSFATRFLQLRGDYILEQSENGNDPIWYKRD